jgi:transcriptional regulator with XRE-family HTH domain
MLNYEIIFSQRLKQVILEKSLTMQQLGGQIGVSKQAVKHWEMAERYPALPLLCRLADVLA